jgi:hypothetical protein
MERHIGTGPRKTDRIITTGQAIHKKPAATVQAILTRRVPAGSCECCTAVQLRAQLLRFCDRDTVFLTGCA